MRIGVLLPHGFFPWDVRVFKEVPLLVAGGHEVSVLCWSEPGEAAVEELLGARVERMRHGKRADRFTNLILKMTGYRWHPFWTRRIKRFIQENRIEALYTHDLRPALIGCRIAKKQGLPVVVDLHDDYPTMNTSAVRNLSARLFNSIKKIDRVQGKVVRMSDRVIVPCLGFMDLFPERYGIPPDKMVLVPNYQDLATLVEPDKMEPIGADPGFFNVTFVGSVGTPGRGVQVAVEAMPHVLERMPDARLVIVGDGSYLPELKKLAERLGVQDSVQFTGWVDFSEVPGYIAGSDVCIITFLKEVSQYNYGNPHKLFQYMAAKKPVLVSDCYEIGRHVRESGSGLVFASGDAVDFAEKLSEMRPEELRRSMGENGFRAVMERYNFESLSDRILEMCSELEKV
ncbi:MAG TPA: glycosyltransferase family 4 protein [Candidatus Anoxymicrobiaceae bacterium]